MEIIELPIVAAAVRIGHRLRRAAAQRGRSTSTPRWPPVPPGPSAPATGPGPRRPTRYRTCFERDLDRIQHSRPVPPPGRQVPGVHRARRRPPPHPAHARHRGRPGRGRHRPARGPQRRPHRGGGHRARLRPRPRRPRVGGGAVALSSTGGYHHAVYGADVVLAPLNLCAETLDAVRNHSWNRPAPLTPEGEVVSWADRIAYVCHDFEDAVRAGIVEPTTCPPRCATSSAPAGRPSSTRSSPRCSTRSRRPARSACARRRPRRWRRSAPSTSSGSTSGPIRRPGRARHRTAAGTDRVVHRQPGRATARPEQPASRTARGRRITSAA